MTLYIGSSEVNKMHLGDYSVPAAYLGVSKVFPEEGSEGYVYGLDGVWYIKNGTYKVLVNTKDTPSEPQIPESIHEIKNVSVSSDTGATPINKNLETIIMGDSGLNGSAFSFKVNLTFNRTPAKGFFTPAPVIEETEPNCYLRALASSTGTIRLYYAGAGASMVAPGFDETFTYSNSDMKDREVSSIVDLSLTFPNPCYLESSNMTKGLMVDNYSRVVPISTFLPGCVLTVYAESYTSTGEEIFTKKVTSSINGTVKYTNTENQDGGSAPDWNTFLRAPFADPTIQASVINYKVEYNQTFCFMPGTEEVRIHSPHLEEHTDTGEIMTISPTSFDKRLKSNYPIGVLWGTYAPSIIRKHHLGEKENQVAVYLYADETYTPDGDIYDLLLVNEEFIRANVTGNNTGELLPPPIGWVTYTCIEGAEGNEILFLNAFRNNPDAIVS